MRAEMICETSPASDTDWLLVCCWLTELTEPEFTELTEPELTELTELTGATTAVVVVVGPDRAAWTAASI